MLKCIIMKRKLYDYLENNLSEIEGLKVKKHLDVCQNCRMRSNQIKTVLDYASAKNTPQPNKEFWHDFKTDLDRKLNAALLRPLTLKPKPKFLLRPAFAYAMVLTFFLAAIGSLYKFHPSPLLQLAQNDEELVSQAADLDELTETSELNHDEDAYLEEIDLLLEVEKA